MIRYYPVLLKIQDRNTVVIGGGKVAFRKVKELLQAGARVTCISPEFDSSFGSIGFDASLVLVRRPYTEGDIDNSFLAISATDDSSVNLKVQEEAERKGILFNAADGNESGDFIVPSCTRHEDLVIAVSTSGASPAYAARIRRKIEEMLPDDVDIVLKALRETRKILSDTNNFNGLTSEKRGEILKQVVANDDLLEDLVSSYTNNNLTQFLSQIISR